MWSLWESSPGSRSHGLCEEGNDHEKDQVLFPNVVQPAPQGFYQPPPVDLMALMSRREMLMWVFIAVLALTLFLLADRADAHPAYLYPEDGVMTVELAKHRSAWLRLMELEELNGPYREEVMSNDPIRVHVAASPLASLEIRTLVEAYFLPQYVDDALNVAWCESKYDPDAANPTSSARGLFQHLGRYWPERSAQAGWAGASILDPEANIAVAAWLSKGGSDWSHWVCKPL